jgi:hypothetical protein
MNPARKSRLIKQKPDEIQEIRKKGVETTRISGMLKLYFYSFFLKKFSINFRRN